MEQTLADLREIRQRMEGGSIPIMGNMVFPDAEIRGLRKRGRYYVDLADLTGALRKGALDPEQGPEMAECLTFLAECFEEQTEFVRL